MKNIDNNKETLKDLAKVKAIFQLRTLEALLVQRAIEMERKGKNK